MENHFIDGLSEPADYSTPPMAMVSLTTCCLKRAEHRHGQAWKSICSENSGAPPRADLVQRSCHYRRFFLRVLIF